MADHGKLLVPCTANPQPTPSGGWKRAGGGGGPSKEDLHHGADLKLGPCPQCAGTIHAEFAEAYLRIA
jgi:hypothetical protein